MYSIKKNKYGYYFFQNNHKFGIRDFDLSFTLGMLKEEFQEKMKEFGAVIVNNNYRGVSEQETFFRSRKKAQQALDWIESEILMYELLEK